MADKLILLAFDGVSKIHTDNAFALRDLKENNFYTEIDLKDRAYYFTSELFTDLITGRTREEHGVDGLRKYAEGKHGLTPHKYEKWMQKNLQDYFFNGIPLPIPTKKITVLDRHSRNNWYKALLGVNHLKWERSDIDAPVIFDTYEHAYQNQVPVYDWRKADVFHHLEKTDRQHEKVFEHIEKEWQYSKIKFWNAVREFDWDKDERMFYMHHFHYIDWIQHMKDGTAEDIKGEMSGYHYNMMEFVEQVEEFCEENDIELAIMSDHGVPMRYEGHLPNAFLTCSTDDIFSENPTLQEMNKEIKRFLEG